MEVKWSDRLEDLAEGMFKAWEEQPQGDPFARTCVVVGDLATRDWLKDYFLLKRKSGNRRVLANIDFKPLPEFVNDWLWLATHGDTAAERKPSEHPYSRGVLTWRIERMLAEMEMTTVEDTVFKPLADYIGTIGVDRRRYALAARIATLFDDYLNLRPEMLAKWESSQDDGVAPEYAWQPALYRRLVAKNENTYARDYAKAKDPSNAAANARASHDLGYAQVHLFDCAFVTAIQDELLECIGNGVPVVKWNLNFKPAHPSATTEGAPVPDVPVELHSCYSPRRELEAVRNGIYAFLAGRPEAKPSDVRVLCADWQNYEPLVAAVFGADWGEQAVAGSVPKRTIPVRICGADSELTPLLQSFGDLMAFADNRFEVNAVFGLLGVPAIRAQFGVPADGVDTLREMAQAANIHWGYDDDDVDAILGLTHADPRVYTWRRGLDRLLVDALMGPRTNADRLVEVGALKRLQPCGNVESGRARLVCSLDAFVRKLAALRCELKKSHTATEWREKLLCAVDGFYRIDGENALELSLIRRSIREVTHTAELSWSVEGGGGNLPEITSGIILSAVVRALSGIHPDDDVHGDSVTFAPLTSGAATAAEFIWICGLNDGAFPRGGDRAAFDLLSANKSQDDFSLRERDVYSLRKAAIAARSKLALSYIGRNIKTNEEIPAAVPLSDLVDEIGSSKPKLLAQFEHPLQSYSVRYFYEQQDRKLPASYSAADRAAAKAIAGRVKDADGAGSPVTVTPFPLAEQGPTAIELEDLVSYVSNSRSYINRHRLGIFGKDGEMELSDDERCEGAELKERERTQIVFGQIDAEGEHDLACALVEQGRSVSAEAAELEIDNMHFAHDALAGLAVDFARNKEDEFACPGNHIVKEYLSELAMPMKQILIEMEICGRQVIVRGQRKSEIELTNRLDEPVKHELFYVGREFYPTSVLACWLRHLAAHAAGANFVSGMFVRELTNTGRPKSVRTFRSPSSALAKERLGIFLGAVVHPQPIPDKDHEVPVEVAAALNYHGFEFHKGH